LTDAAGRYTGRPFLRLIEFYVLWSIGELSESHARAMEEMTPNLQTTYQSQGTWQRIIAEQMEFPETLAPDLRATWDRNIDAARARGASIDPEEFARQVADQLVR
jgi:uncharacterized protein (DUF2252 family)